MKKQNTDVLVKIFDRSFLFMDFPVKNDNLAFKKKGSLNILSCELLEWE